MKRFGFSLMEMIVVILIIAVLAGIAIPIMKGRIDRSKWTEANAAAGMIRGAVKLHFFQDGVAVTGSMGDAENQAALSITAGDLTGAYFVPSDYEIISVNDDGNAVVTVTGSQSNAPEGTKTLTLEGDFE